MSLSLTTRLDRTNDRLRLLLSEEVLIAISELTAEDFAAVAKFSSVH